METRHTFVVIGSFNMNLIFSLCLINIVSLTTTQTIVKCFDKNKGTNRTGIILDCSKTNGNSYPYTTEEWIRYQAFLNDGIVANHVININLENNDFQRLFKLPLLNSLKKLSFKFNNISSIENLALSNLPVLEELDLSYNALNSHELRLTIFRNQQHQNKRFKTEQSTLKVLKLGYNNIHSLLPTCFEYLKKLETLELNNNPLSVIDQNTEIALGNLKNLQVLDLSNTGISEFPVNMFSRLTNVQTMYLNGNYFQNIPKEIRDMPLAYLNLNANPINYLNSESFVGLDKLQQLILSGMPNLTNIGSGTFAPLKKLITLRMAYNPYLSNIHYDAFRDHTTNEFSLKQLYISNSNLSSIDSKLYPFTKLDLFDAKSNPWTCDCRLSWLADYINETFAEIPEIFLYYRCNSPQDLVGTLVSQFNEHVDCHDYDYDSVHHSHGHVTRLRHFIIVITIVISIFLFGVLVNIGCREIKKALRIYVPARFSTGVKYRPADFEENADSIDAPVKNIMIHGRSPIVINNTD